MIITFIIFSININKNLTTFIEKYNYYYFKVDH